MLMQWEERKNAGTGSPGISEQTPEQLSIRQQAVFLWRPLFFGLSLSSLDIASAVFLTSLLRAFVTRSTALASFLAGTTVFSTSFLTHIFSLFSKVSV
jgi:hypothetical protein